MSALVRVEVIDNDQSRAIYDDGTEYVRRHHIPIDTEDDVEQDMVVWQRENGGPIYASG